MKEMENQNNFYFPKKTHFWGVVILIVVVMGFVAETNTKTENNNFYADILRLESVATKIHQNYVEEIQSEDLIDSAILGMLKMLDPHTSFFKEKEYEELRIHTEGRFGGLGIQISIRDKVLTVMTPMPETPASRAGIQSGDQIVKIEGKPTKGISLDEAVTKLRGEPGSEVSITIRRKGENKPLEYVLTREIITIKSVPYWGILSNNIGYIRLNTFSQEAGDEVEKAIKGLIDQKINGLIFDLRYNPGGLLPQAIEVAEKFLDKRSLVVSTRGRVKTQNKDYHARSNPVFPENMPLVVLVNAASASASEIVAGAIQDWDRGVVLGDTTFGKGSVQSILPLDKEHHLKLTTAFYYTPSGRCINKAENGIPGTSETDEEELAEGFNNKKSQEDDDNAVQKAQDSTQDTTAEKENASIKYRTHNGRIVYGGGGIIPDTVVKPEEVDPAIQSLILKDVFFKFANTVYPSLQKENIVVDSTFTVDQKILNDFYSFLDSTDFKFETFTQIKFDEFKRWAGLVSDSADSAKVNENFDKPQWSESELKTVQTIVSQLDSVLASAGKKEFGRSEEDIKRLLREALLGRALGQNDPLVYRTRLSKDTQIISALNLFANKEEYELLLKPGKTGDK